jgi:SpoVK/Ycf46/Vps4 family AAA+-type ATPase
LIYISTISQIIIPKEKEKNLSTRITITKNKGLPTMSYFVKKGKTFRLTSKESLDLRERLPVGTYSVGFDPCASQYFLETIDPFEINHKLYGNTTRDANRILQTFKDRTASTGVLLTGLKGSGKTLLTKSNSLKAAEDDIPTIVVNQPFCGDEFNSFIQAIHQPAVVLFDEYEKVYFKPNNQEQLLTLLDGVYPSQKLFLLTCNDKWRINENMRNRPGRIYYMLEFAGLDADFIQEFCEDNLARSVLRFQL